MKIIRKNQNRRDFSADMECEGCGNKVEFRGYDDKNYHDNVLPKRKCAALLFGEMRRLWKIKN